MSQHPDTHVTHQILPADPRRQFESDRHLLDPVIRSVLESGWYILGRACEQFEDTFGAFIGRQACVGVASGTDAIELSLRVSGISEGDEVILPSLAPSACVTAVCRTGGDSRICRCRAGTPHSGRRIRRGLHQGTGFCHPRCSPVWSSLCSG